MKSWRRHSQSRTPPLKTIPVNNKAYIISLNVSSWQQSAVAISIHCTVSITGDVLWFWSIIFFPFFPHHARHSIGHWTCFICICVGVRAFVIHSPLCYSFSTWSTVQPTCCKPVPDEERFQYWLFEIRFHHFSASTLHQNERHITSPASPSQA